ncbi:pentatricopeptide repeat-containing protein At1g14470 [Phoenix dactylifera]|uniref:Pentatricopeptide repeat-containing protein At1g14470 n=1 Tax=Phoenix dactylifera TaxID=42345 RepID=A0A8B8ZF73_PHODC|nr:pentatricopeptide repeat-containing protein At1g14470 [Phoenix dactylifera]XP_026659009.2 pentatricopeptide repeat-containing protein At1g14470 [Phoenix dactylifera]XP_026659011.2 pentatricopeptide repeat-containing protein At1g14470 [Phoenix dactylifera]XP_026659012.2 pentatricopeptide repeat-containing protein At1g14470 [Phoenix dactylifera]XP_026659013.2 pentatricopeptide repeat-containing protein At1g14470 [Phoenix dactylifera]XP_026659015.2 pentatricopeptide repeat-containing protein A
MSHLTLASSRVKTFDHLRQLHAQLILHSLHGESHWLTLLLTRCARIQAPLPYARLLFESIPHPTARAFATMFKHCSQLGTHEDVAALFARMSSLAVTPDASLYPILIKWLGSDAISLHARILKLGHASDRYVRNAIMNFYAHHGSVETAERLFDEMPERTVVDWNSMLSAYWKWDCRKEALRMFDSMPDRNIISWTVMVSGLSRVGEFDVARRFFDEMPERSIVSWNAMLSGYTQNGQAEEALRLFDRMMGVGIQPNETTWVVVITACSMKGDLRFAESLVGSLIERNANLNCFIKTALIDMYASCRSLAKARKIFYEMEDQNLVSWNAMIAAYTREGDLSAAKELFDVMPARDVVSWNSMISGYAQNGQWSPAIELFKEMAIVKGLKPDEVTMSSIIAACGHLGALEFGRWLVCYISENQIRLNISGYNALIFMYSRCGSIEDARRVFREMSKRDVFSYNSLISGLASIGEGLEVLKLMENMEEERIEPDNITYLGILTGCSHAGLLLEGCRVFEMIESPTVDHYACKVDLLGRAGRLDEAKRVIDGMPLKPHAGVYGALLNACRIHKRVKLAEFAARELFKLEPENSGNYVLLSNIYASAGRWGDGESVREIMRKRGVDKMIGCSWVEFGGKVHQFVAGDRSHCQSEEIHEMLKEVGRKMRALGYIAEESLSLEVS